MPPIRKIGLDLKDVKLVRSAMHIATMWRPTLTIRRLTECGDDDVQ
jgi:hypothetical protein